MKAEKQEKNKCQILNEKLWIGKTKIAIVPCSSGSRSGGLGALYNWQLFTTELERVKQKVQKLNVIPLCCTIFGTCQKISSRKWRPRMCTMAAKAGRLYKKPSGGMCHLNKVIAGWGNNDGLTIKAWKLHKGYYSPSVPMVPTQVQGKWTPIEQMPLT